MSLSVELEISTTLFRSSGEIVFGKGFPDLSPGRLKHLSRHPVKRGQLNPLQSEPPTS